MPGLQAADIIDLVNSTLKDLDYGKVTEIATDTQDHVVANVFMRTNSKGETPRLKKYGSGTALQWSLLTGHNNSAAFQGLYHRFTVNQTDGTTTATMPWAHGNYNWTFEQRELAMNRSVSRIWDYMKLKKRMGHISWAELLEASFWDAPSAADTDAPFGLPYWVTKNATEGFTGGPLAGHSDRAGLSLTTYPRLKNYAFPFVNIDDDDFIEKLSRAMRETKFISPMGGKDSQEHASANGVSGRMLATNGTMLTALERLARSNNDNLGNNVIAKFGEVMVNQHKVRWVPRLDDDTTNPFYGIDLDMFMIGYLADWFMKVKVIPELPDQPTVGVTHTFTTFNYFCYSPRTSFVGSNGTSYPT